MDRGHKMRQAIVSAQHLFVIIRTLGRRTSSDSVPDPPENHRSRFDYQYLFKNSAPSCGRQSKDFLPQTTIQALSSRSSKRHMEFELRLVDQPTVCQGFSKPH